jgi:hypothetical protein
VLLTHGHLTQEQNDELKDKHVVVTGEAAGLGSGWSRRSSRAAQKWRPWPRRDPWLQAALNLPLKPGSRVLVDRAGCHQPIADVGRLRRRQRRTTASRSLR